jgi:hypothetical protein
MRWTVNHSTSVTQAKVLVVIAMARAPGSTMSNLSARVVMILKVEAGVTYGICMSQIRVVDPD